LTNGREITMKNLDYNNFSVLAAEEMFNVRGGDGELIPEGQDKDIIL